MAKAELTAAIADLGLTIDAVFVPWSRSRNAKPRPRLSDRGLNWSVTMKRDGREVMTFDYSAGIGHCPSYKQGVRLTLDYAEAIATETETGCAASVSNRWFKGKAILPEVCDVVYSCVIDSNVIDYPDFASWAADFGYDVDSRKAEAIYRACMDTALRMRAALGDAGMEALRTATQDY